MAPTVNAWQHYWSKLPLWLQWGLGLILAWQLGRWVAQALQPVSPPQLPPLQFTQPDFQRHPLSAALFGQTRVQSPTPVAPPTRKMRPEQLGIKVAGVIALENGQGVAVIRHQGKSRVVRVGEQIAPNIRLEAVAPDSITVMVNGERVWVPLQKSKGHAQRLAQAPETTAQDISPQALRNVANQLRHRPFKVFEFASFQPTSEGLRVQARPGKAQWLAAIGLEDGDIVTAVDGQPVKVLMHQPPRWRQLMYKQQWQLEVIRNGVRQSIEVRVP